MKVKYEALFFYITAIAGVLIAVLTPPMCSPDENYHFYITYNLAKGNSPKTINGSIGYYTDQEVYDFIQKYNQNNSGLDVAYSFKEAYESGFTPSEIFHKAFIEDDYNYDINPIPHLIGAIGIKIGEMFCHIFKYKELLTPYNYLLFVRFGNLLFYMLAIYYTIKRVPCFKKTITMLSLMPMSLFMAASTSNDAVLIPVSFFFFSSLLIWMTDESKVIGVKDILTLIVSVFFLANIKLIVIPFLALLLFISRNKFKNKNIYMAGALSCAGVVLAGVFLINLNSLVFGKYIDNGFMEQQKVFLSNNAGMFPVIVINTVRTYFNFWLEGFYGKLGNLDLNFPLPLLIMFYVSLLFVVVSEGLNSRQIGAKLKLATVAVYIATLLYMIYYFYITWTAKIGGIGAAFSTGIQGRYFIPISVYIVFVFMSSYLTKFKYNDKIMAAADRMTIVSAILYPMLSVIFILLKYYMNT